MLKVYHGFKRAFTSIIIGFILAPLLKYVLNYYDLAEFIILFYLISFIGIFLLYKKMKFWSIWYSLGWIIGILIFYQLLDRIELIFYIIIFIIAIVYNMKNKIKRKLRKI
jgi:hypothetical protein